MVTMNSCLLRSGCLFLIGMGLVKLNFGMALSVNARETHSTAIAARPHQTQSTAAIVEQLQGQWLPLEMLPGPISMLIFAPQGRLLLMPRNPADGNKLVANPAGYRINPHTHPMQMDIVLDPQTIIRTVFEFTANGDLRVQLAETGPGKPRPAALTEAATLFQKISDSTELPPGVTLQSRAEMQAAAIELEARVTLQRINRVQQAYYLEYRRFGTTFAPLGIPAPAADKYYRYQIVPQGNQKQTVAVTATALQPGLRSMTGAAFSLVEQGRVVTLSALCISDQASQKPPDPPFLDRQASAARAMTCPSGSFLFP